MVAEAAAKNLIPCILELGGKCPAVVDTSADVDFAASKVAFARFNNSGQTCIATDYVLVHESLKARFLDRLKHHIKAMYGDHDGKGSADMGKVITEWHCTRLKELIDGSKGEIVCGGKVDTKLKYVEPTVIIKPDLKSKVMDEEIFGPVLPLMTYSNMDEVIDFINSKDKALAVYYFGKCYSNPNLNKLMDNTSSGAFVVNECVV